MNRQRTLIALGAALLIAALAMQSAPFERSASAATATVSVMDNLYSPSSITVTVGDTVQWNWAGANPHTVTSTSAEPFDSSPAKTSGVFTHTFSTAGSFGYMCQIHGTSMSGTVIVQAAAATDTATATNTAAASTSTPLPTNTPAPTNTPGSITPTGSPTGSTGTPAAPVVASTSTATIALTAPVATATRSGGAAAGAQLPRTGTGAGKRAPGGAPWLSLLLATGGVAAVVAAVGLRRRA